MIVDEQQIYANIGSRLRERRKAMHLTQAEVAERLGMLRSTLANIETARQRITLHTLYRIVAELGIPISDVLPEVERVIVHTPIVVEPDQVPAKTRAVLDALEQRRRNEE